MMPRSRFDSSAMSVQHRVRLLGGEELRPPAEQMSVAEDGGDRGSGSAIEPEELVLDHVRRASASAAARRASSAFRRSVTSTSTVRHPPASRRRRAWGG